MALTDSLVNLEAHRSPASGGNRGRARNPWRPLLLQSHRVVTEPALPTAVVTRARESAAHTVRIRGGIASDLRLFTDLSKGNP